MELFLFCRGLLAWMTTVSICLLLSVPMAALAFRVKHGPKELEIEPGELWYRAFLAAFMMGLASVAFLFLDWYIVESLAFPSGPIHLVLVMAYIPVGMWIMTFYFGFSDLLDGLSVFTIFIALPVILLWAVNYFTGAWNWALNLAYAWLPPVPTT